ncbi:GtrA family protein [Paenibacillus farraposensis]|uniref:GtrA family protein n=1 Tax=Paenibacillus farraposensis TaxID=2807095 RepID=A0ABW4DG42_9BACL
MISYLCCWPGPEFQLLHTGTELPLALCKLIATAAGMIINYIGSRYWVFGSLSRRKVNRYEKNYKIRYSSR